MTSSPDQAVEPRFVTVSRRVFLGRAAALGALAAVPGVACGRDDSSAFADAEPVDLASTDTSAATSTSPDTITAPSTAAPTTTTETSTSPETTTTEMPPAEATALAGELLVSFTYRSDGSGRGDHRPYIAVWIEDPDGELVDTISLWFLQSQKGTRWLDDLSRWYTASDRGSDTTMSGATREAGTYTVAWDGTDLAGAPVPPGDYVVLVEAAREDGPYSLTSAAITLGGEPTSVSLPNDVELLDIRADWSA